MSRPDPGHLSRILDKPPRRVPRLTQPCGCLYTAAEGVTPTIYRGHLPATLLKVTVDARARGERRGARFDPWRTIAGWLWSAYIAGVAALVMWLCR
jgi:hypothetical protein